MKKLLAAIAAILLSVSIASAEGPVVGKSCVARWTNAIDPFGGGTITTNIYVEAGVKDNPTGAPAYTGLPGQFALICQPLTPGQYTAWAQAVDSFNDGRAVEVSPLTLPVPFVLSVLPAPSGFGIFAK